MLSHRTPLASSKPQSSRSADIGAAAVHYSDDDEQSPTAVHEKHRWLLLLIPLAVSAAFFAAAIATGRYWLLAPAAAFGPWALITGFVHLSLTADAEQADEDRRLQQRQHDVHTATTG
jgi:hypothetical protein